MFQEIPRALHLFLHFFFFKSFDPRPKVPLSPHLLHCFPVLKSLPLSCSSHLLQHVTLEGSDSSENFCFAHFPLRCLLLYEAPHVARTGGFLAPLTFIAKDQPPALRTAEGEVRVVEWVGVFFFLLQQKPVGVDRVAVAMEESPLEKSKDQKVQPLLLHGICSACMLCHPQRPRHCREETEFKS